MEATLEQVWAAIQWRPGLLLGIYPDLPTVACEATRDVEVGYDASYCFP